MSLLTVLIERFIKVSRADLGFYWRVPKLFTTVEILLQYQHHTTRQNTAQGCESALSVDVSPAQNVFAQAHC